MSRFAELLGKGLALAGFLFTVLTYAYNQYVDRQEERYSQATALIEKYSDSGIRGYENRLTQRLLYYNAGAFDVNDPQSYPDSAFDLIAKETLFGYDGGASGGGTDIKPFLDEFMAIMDFYAQVGFCLDSGICDAEILRRYFCPRAGAFAARNQRLIAYYERYEGSEEMDDELDRLNRRCAEAG